MNRLIRAILLLGFFGVGSTAPAQFTFTRIVNTGTPLDGGGTYPASTIVTPFSGGEVSVSGGLVVFSGSTFAGSTASGSLYSGSGGGNTRVVITGDTNPSGDTFRHFLSPSLSGTAVAFAGGPPPPPNTGTLDFTARGVYTRAGATLTRIADTTTTMPNTATNFERFTSVGSSGSTVAFAGDRTTSQQWQGVYTALASGGPLTVVADSSTPVPNGGGLQFSRFSSVRADGSSIAFQGGGGLAFDGVYRARAGAVTRIADTTMSFPGTTTNFYGFASPSLSGNRVAFVGLGSTLFGMGVYSGTGGPLTLIANTSTQRPNGGTFTGFKKVEVSGSLAVFQEADAFGTGTGLYLRDASGVGSITKILAAGDTLDGKTVASFGNYSLDPRGSNLAFTATFTDNTVGVYLTPVPEPAAALTLAIGCAAAGTAVRRRLRHRLS